MEKTLIIVEKPSVAKNFASFVSAKRQGKDNLFISDKYVIIPCFGHLLQLYDMKDYDSKFEKWDIANFPYIPVNFKFKITNDNGIKRQVQLIQKYSKSNDVKNVFLACDFDQEGTAIGANLANFCKWDKPTFRMLYKGITKEDFDEAVKSPVPRAEQMNYEHASLSRAVADWMIGINLTTVTTLKLNQADGVLNIGRVILPIVKFVYDRELEISNFKPQSFFELKADIKCVGGTFTATYLENEKTRFDEKKLNTIMRNLKKPLIKNLIKKQTKQSPAKLHSMTTIQQHLSKKFNVDISKTFKACQSLYESGYMSYPRTESRVLMESEAPKMEKILTKIANIYNIAEFSFLSNDKLRKTVFNDKQVISHSGLTPTNKLPDLTKLNEIEKLVFEEISKNFLSQFMDKAIFTKTEIIVDITGKDFTTFVNAINITNINELPYYFERFKENFMGIIYTDLCNIEMYKEDASYEAVDMLQADIIGQLKLLDHNLSFDNVKNNFKNDLDIYRSGYVNHKNEEIENYREDDLSFLTPVEELKPSFIIPSEMSVNLKENGIYDYLMDQEENLNIDKDVIYQFLLTHMQDYMSEHNYSELIDKLINTLNLRKQNS